MLNIRERLVYELQALRFLARAAVLETCWVPVYEKVVYALPCLKNNSGNRIFSGG